MGKETTTCNGDSEESIGERIKKKKRRKELEEIRRNVLAAKRNLHRNKQTATQKSKPTLMMKCLSEYAKKRAEVENAIQCQDSLLISSGKNNDHNYEKQVNENPTQNRETRDIIDQILPKPFNHRGFFRAGIKGKVLTRPLGTEERKFKNAVLQGDALQIFQSGGFCRSNNNNLSQKQLDPLSIKEISKILQDSSESSSEGGSSIDKIIISSPVLGRNRSTKKKGDAEKSNANRAGENISQSQTFITKNTTKEERCKRRLFEEENTSVNNNKYISSVNSKFDFERKSTPENKIYFTERTAHEDVNITLNEKRNDHKISLADPKLIKCYVQTCKIIAEKNFKDVFQNSKKDPMESAKLALKMTYTSTFKTYLQRQNRENSERFCKSDQKTDSTFSEIMMEPDSAIARTLKKNKQLQAHEIERSSENNSDVSSIHNLDDLQSFCISGVDSVNKNTTKRKYISSKGKVSEVDVPSSTMVNVNPESTKIELKMDAIHPDRQELIARYLKDVITNKRHEDEVRYANKKFNSEIKISDNFEKEKLFVNNSNKKSYFVHKNAKHIPAILRKSRTLADYVAKEKVSLGLEKSQKVNELFPKSSMQDFNTNKNIMSEHTPDCGNLVANQSMEAPKCKYTYMIAKYNQPSRIHVPMMQAKRCLRNNVPERKNLFASPQHLEVDNQTSRMHIPVMQNKTFYRNIAPERKNLLLSPNKNVEKEFILSQQIVLSPIEDNKYNFHKCHLSQENSKQETNCMVRMVSFNDIQERTDRLTLQSSQSQVCSQESVDKIYSSQENCYNSHSDIYYQQCDSSDNCANYINHPPMTFNNNPAPTNYDVVLNPNYNLHSHSNTRMDENQSYNSLHDYRVIVPKIYPCEGTKDFNCCLSKDRQINKNLGLRNTKSCMSPIAIEQQNLSQPVKFIAVEGNRLPQRHPIYSLKDNNSCSHVHKIAIPNQRCNRVIKSCYPRDASNRPCYGKASIQFSAQGVSDSVPNSEFKLKAIHKTNNAVPMNLQRTLSFGSENPDPTRGLANYVPSNMPEPTFISHPADANNKRYVGQRMPSPMYSQVEYPHNHCNANDELYDISDITYRR